MIKQYGKRQNKAQQYRYGAGYGSANGFYTGERYEFSRRAPTYRIEVLPTPSELFGYNQ